MFVKFTLYTAYTRKDLNTHIPEVFNIACAVVKVVSAIIFNICDFRKGIKIKSEYHLLNLSKTQKSYV